MTGLELWWIGQAGFRFRHSEGGPTVFVDPYLLVREDRTWQAPLTPAELARAELVLSTHEHTDHFDEPSLREAAAQPDARFTLILPRPLEDRALALGLPRKRVIGAQPGEVLDLHGIRVHPVRASHGVNVSDAYTFGEEISDGLVRYLGYVIELGGVRVYHAGDCIPYSDQVEDIRALRPDVACLPINGRDFFRETERNIVGNMDPREAARLASDVGASILVPMHWELFPRNTGSTSELAAWVASNFPHLTLLVMGRGARIVVQPPRD